MKTVRYIVLFVVAALMSGAIYIYAGIYPIGADVPHSKLGYWLLETVRERSITVSSNNIFVPPLDDTELLLAGGRDYNDMCATCHLKPGEEKSEMSIGLYPSPPNLSRPESEHQHEHVDGDHDDPEQRSRRQFWIIKHGIKATGMPAWGPTHDDQRIWAMVAFIQKLPELDENQYQSITARVDSHSGHHH